MPSVLDPLAPEQQYLLDIVAEAFIAEKYEWPLFDYVEGTLDNKGLDANETIESFPRIGRFKYAAVWRKSNQETAEVALTIVGMHHAAPFRDFEPLPIPMFFALLEFLAQRRRDTPLTPRKTRTPSVTWKDVRIALAGRGFSIDELPTGFVYDMMEREPPTQYGGGSSGPGAQWTKYVDRGIFDYEGVASLEDYVARIERLTGFPQPMQMPATPSPFSLVAALDYLDAVWRDRTRQRQLHLFSYPSAERAAKVGFEANTLEELDNRLTALGEILRTANKSAKAASRVKIASATRSDPLAPLKDHLARISGAAATEARIRQAVTDLEHALALRDAAQHTEAGDRAVRALNSFGIDYPIADATSAWATVNARVVDALSAIREQLSSASE
jgi:hypothetical protein